MPAEHGIGVGNEPSDLDVIIDHAGKVVSMRDIYDYRPLPHDGLAWFTLEDPLP